MENIAGILSRRARFSFAGSENGADYRCSGVSLRLQTREDVLEVVREAIDEAAMDINLGVNTAGLCQY